MAPMYQVVLDTNVLVSALRSKRGASHRLIRLIGDSRWQAITSVALVLEYEAVALRHCASLGIRASVATDIVDVFCADAKARSIFAGVRRYPTRKMNSSSIWQWLASARLSSPITKGISRV